MKDPPSQLFVSNLIHRSHDSDQYQEAKGGKLEKTFVMGSQSYNVPVILPDLRREESYHQLVDALEYLDAVANDIFGRITCRFDFSYN